MVEITFPVHIESTAVYDTVVDSDGRLVTFVSMCERNRARAEYIAKALNEAHAKETETALQELADQGQEMGI